ncbi:signal peptidase I [Planococcus sp. N028]|uniref:Signal peptidase I n=1 Tax=Planococcus shixiaomingii TaxID=3058393 RepID=A0ABT8MYH1_9BACL|nr:signal peptidase I [Planococcus sp. N028]MDN7240648.1 signal peptidase I [Planococcus sp. N028]
MKLLLLSVFVLLLGACSAGEAADKKENSVVSEAAASEVVKDEDTKPEVELVEANGNTKLIQWLSDSMDRGNHDYDTMAHSELVVELNYSEANRGDVIYYKTPESAVEKNPQLPEFYIARVVGLPGETVEIRAGQVYVDDKKLDTFYGVATDRGLGKDDYFKMAEQNIEEGTWTTDEEVSKKELITWVNMDAKEEYFATSIEPVKVTTEAVFVLVDQWWRGTDSRDFGELPLERVEGKVIGYVKNK